MKRKQLTADSDAYAESCCLNSSNKNSPIIIRYGVRSGCNKNALDKGSFQAVFTASMPPAGLASEKRKRPGHYSILHFPPRSSPSTPSSLRCSGYVPPLPHRRAQPRRRISRYPPYAKKGTPARHAKPHATRVRNEDACRAGTRAGLAGPAGGARAGADARAGAATVVRLDHPPAE